MGGVQKGDMQEEKCKVKCKRWSAKGEMQKEKCKRRVHRHRRNARGECKGEKQEAKCKRWSAKAECKGRIEVECKVRMQR